MLTRRLQLRSGGPAAEPTWLPLALAAGGAAFVVLEHGFRERVFPHTVFATLQFALAYAAMATAGLFSVHRFTVKRWRTRVGLGAEIVFLIALLDEIAGLRVGAAVAAVAVASWASMRAGARLARTVDRPELLFPASFLLLISLVTALLLCPAATPPDQPIGFTDALFTATSAVCVTGLTVRETATGFTTFGQATIGVGIQLGGLGVMIFGSTIALLLGSRLGLREHVTLSRAIGDYPAHRMSRFVVFIVLTTLIIEAIGAAALYAAWPKELAPDVQTRIGHAVFHSVSAFCNAGFDLTGESLVPMRGQLAVLSIFAPLIIVGGLGFVVLEEVWRIATGRAPARRAPGARRRLSTHAKLVLVTTGALLVIGFAVMLPSQWLMHRGDLAGVAHDAAFLSVTTRTAGFTTLPPEELSGGTRFAMMLLMAIGGSPGSTAGGMKTVVIGVLALSVYATARGRDEVELFGRALPDSVVKRCATVAFGVAALIAATTLTLAMTEQRSIELLLFESVSAATTTGLSLGVTGELSDAGRWVLSATMFLGRVGPLAAMAALVTREAARRGYKLPRDDVQLG